MAILFKNNASTKLASGITAAATSMSVVAGTGDLFPAPGANEYFLCTVVDDLGNKEIVKVTSRSADVFTIVRAQEGTTARAFNANSLVENRLTAGALNEVLNVTYASAAEVAAGTATNKAISPATVRSAKVASATTATTAGTCTGNAATASDMAAGHVLAGKTTAEAVRSAIGAPSPNIGKYSVYPIVRSTNQTLPLNVEANIASDATISGTLPATQLSGYFGWTVPENGTYRIDVDFSAQKAVAGPCLLHVFIKRASGGITSYVTTALLSITDAASWYHVYTSTPIQLISGDAVLVTAFADGAELKILSGYGRATLTRLH